MAQELDCSPLYEGGPDFTVGPDAFIPPYTQARSRLFAGGTFFRSKLTFGGSTDSQSPDCNDVSLRVYRPDPFNDRIDLVVYFRGEEVERYITTQVTNCTAPGNPPPPAGIGGNVAIPDLRTQTETSEYIMMPARGTDAQDSCIEILFILDCPEDAACLVEFNDTNMSGGTGIADADIPNIKTGPERTLAYITQYEDANGNPVVPSQNEKLVQYDYDNLVFIPYVPNADCRI